MADDDLRINTLHRFAKHSPKLILQQYSHCEVPAGCGGVVLRWVDPAQGRPAVVRINSPDARGTLWLDGAQLESNLASLRPGRHVLALHMTRERFGAHPFSLSVTYDRDEDDLLLLGAPRWRCTTVEPGEGWTSPSFDDTSWVTPTVATEQVMARQPPWFVSTIDRVRRQGTSVFQFDGDGWLRLAFTIEESPR